MSLKLAAAFCRRIGIGFRAGVGIVKLLESEQKFGNTRHRELMGEVAAKVSDGTPLAKAMIEQGKYFPPMLIQMVHIGEATGRLERTLLELADHYDHRLQMRRDFLSAITWPLIQLVAACS